MDVIEMARLRKQYQRVRGQACGAVDGLDLAVPEGDDLVKRYSLGMRQRLGLAAAVEFALAAIGRSTAAALGIGFAHLAVVEAVLRGVRPRWQHWLLGDNAAVVVSNQPQSFPLVDRSALEAAVLLACYTLALLAAAVATFRQRDIA